jgi:aryl sulfotransferase
LTENVGRRVRVCSDELRGLAEVCALHDPFTMNEPLLTRPIRTVRDYLSSSLVWGDFLARGGFVPGDIVVADPFKAGTTWTQRILQQILDDGEEPAEELARSSPWLDSSWGDHERMLDSLVEQRSERKRRVIKSHLPADAIPLAPQARYVFVGRNGKDIGISFHNYLKQFNADTMAAIDRIHAEWSGDPSHLVIPDDMQEFFDRWLATSGYGCCDLFDVVASWWKVRSEPNVLLVHYQRLKEDLRGEVVRMAQFIGIDPQPLRIEKILEHCSFEYMKSRAEQLAPFGGKHMRQSEAFFHKGPRRDFRTELRPEQIQRFDRIALERLGPECALWLETGSMDDPRATPAA